jgi:hypothetical protein
VDRRWSAAVFLGCALASAGAAAAGDTTYDIGGRLSPQIAITAYPDNSAFRDIFGSSSVDSAFDARVVFGLQHDRWSLDVDYQLVGIYSDRLEFTRELSEQLPEEFQGLFPHLPDDSTRLFDLTHVMTDSGKSAALQRLDRLAVGYVSDHLVWKFGRQAISWGNGLIYTVMDIFNPFDPAAVDKEFKTGDDMLYGQWLRGNGDDLQGVMVFRRDPISGDVEADHGSLALKYHLMASISEYDALVAQHYGDTMVGVGVNYSIGGAVWRGDLAVTFTDDDTVPSLVTSLSQSWTWGGTNVSGVAEYFYNGFGQGDGCYSPTCLAANPKLLKRVARGELFTLAQHYVAVSAMIEVHPLFLLTPNVFVNVADPSALLQVVFQNDLRENLMLWSAIALPVGADGTEFGGAELGVPDLYLSTGPSASVQLVWYW